MKELRAVVSDEEFAELDRLAQGLRVSMEELVKRSLATYVAQAKAEPAIEPIGFSCGSTGLRCKMRRSGWPSCGTGNGRDDGPRYRRVHRPLSGAGSRDQLYPKSRGRSASDHGSHSHGGAYMRWPGRISVHFDRRCIAAPEEETYDGCRARTPL